MQGANNALGKLAGGSRGASAGIGAGAGLPTYPWTQWRASFSASLMPGTTYYINDFMAVGHAMHDIHLLQLLNTTRIDRIIIQRAPCATKDLCVGLGTWKSFYHALYSTMLEAANSMHTLIYVRFHEQETSWTERPILQLQQQQKQLTDSVPVGRHADASTGGVSVGGGVGAIGGSIPVKSMLCFSRAFHRDKISGYYFGVSAELSTTFKETAYRLAELATSSDAGTGTGAGAVVRNESKSKKTIRVIYAHRGQNHYRELVDPKVLQIFILSQLEGGLAKVSAGVSVSVDLFDTSLQMSFQEQVRTVAGADVVICTHGAFETNVIYMRKHSLLLEIRGSGSVHYDENALAYNHLSNMFQVHFRSVKAAGLQGLQDKSYSLMPVELERIGSLVLEWAEITVVGGFGEEDM